MKKNFKCPRCEFKCDLDAIVCPNCGMIFSRLKVATNAEAKRAYKLKEKDRVVLSTSLPCDVDKVKFLLLLIFLGWAGAHNFYVGKKGKGWYSIISLLAYIGAMTINYFVNGMFWTGTNFFVYELTEITGLAEVGAIFIWAMDIINYIFHKYKYPISLPLKEKDNNRGIDYEKIEESLKKESLIKDDEKDSKNNENNNDSLKKDKKDNSTQIETDNEKDNENIKIDSKNDKTKIDKIEDKKDN
jgi:TM2 domain-containing membrane protein YozV